MNEQGDRTLVCAAEPWNFEFDPRQSALLVIDMQKDFCARGGYLEGIVAKGLADEAVETLRKPIGPLRQVLDASREASLIVIYTIECHWPDLSDLPDNKRDGAARVGAPIGSEGPLGRLLVRGEEGCEIVEELAPLAGEHVVHKPGKGAFFATDLDHILRNRGITHLIFSGITTDCCVLATRFEARYRGYHTLMLEDCCAATPPAGHDAVFAMVRAHPQAFGLASSSAAFVRALAPARRHGQARAGTGSRSFG